MINRKDYEEAYCPDHLDSVYPQNWRRRKYAIEYLNEKDIPPYSDGDTMMIVYAPVIGDTDLDLYSIGVYIKLQLLLKFNHPWREIFSYGKSENVEKALNKLLQNQHLIYKEQTDTLILRDNI